MLTQSRLSYLLALVLLVNSSPAQADDCNTLIDGLVDYIQAPRAANECLGTYHVVGAIVQTSHVNPIHTPSSVSGLPSITTEIPLATVSVTSTPDTVMNIAKTGPHGQTPQPIRPYVLRSGNNQTRYYSDGYPPFSKSDRFKVIVTEGAVGQPATVTLEYKPKTVTTTKFTKLSVTGSAICKGSFLFGTFDSETAFTVSLYKTRTGSCS